MPPKGWRGKYTYTKKQLDNWDDLSEACGGCKLALARCACGTIANDADVESLDIDRLSGLPAGADSPNSAYADHLYYTWRTPYDTWK